MFDLAELYRQAQRGATLLTPNLRSARQLRSLVASHATAQAERATLAERVLHWRAWTAGLWQGVVLSGRDERVLLQPLQERLLWEEVLDEDPAVERTDALLDLCISAATLLYRHDARDAFLSERHNIASEDTARFARWFRAFERRCSSDLLLPPAALEWALAAEVEPETATQTLILCDLAGLSPAQNNLLAALEKAGTAPTAASRASATTGRPVLLRCRDDQDELSALARHLAISLQSSQRPSIAVVVPDLSSSRDRINRTMREHLQACVGNPFAEDRRPLWEFSTGRPLAAVGVVADALHLLTWTVRELEAGEISLLLRSPHLDWPTDAETAASLDAALLRRHAHLRGTWSPRAAAHLLQRNSPNLAAALQDRTASWPTLRHGTGSFSSFVERTRQILRQFGWFRSGERTSTEFQAVTRLQGTLDTLTTLDLIATEPPTWPAFLERLVSAARTTSFARENTGAPIQFLTPEESTGITASELWTLHADEVRWSNHASPHPLLSWHLQRSHGMPGVDPARDGVRFREQVDRIAQIATVVTFSYAETGAAGEQRPCPQVVALPNIECREADPAGVAEHLRAAAKLQTFDDGALIPLSLENDPRPIPGGVSVLQSQAACAFRAFAERRLGSTTLDTRDLGLDARDRGSLLHDALQLFWHSTGDSKTLLRLIADGRLASAIHHAVSAALQNHREDNDRWSEAYLDIQRTRLEFLLERWLRREAERPRFRVVALEQELTVTVGGLPLKVRIDRIDEVTLDDGSKAHVILDYKTGLPTAKKWEGDRPDEPQLPLYATSALSQVLDEDEAPVGAIAFGVVRAGDKLDFVSAPQKSAWLSREPKANTADLSTELENWRQTLQTLAEDFSNGIASVGPKEYPGTCRYCEQRLLCRLNPALLNEEDVSETEA